MYPANFISKKARKKARYEKMGKQRYTTDSVFSFQFLFCYPPSLIATLYYKLYNMYII